MAVDESFWQQYAASYDRILPLMPFYQVAVRRHLRVILSNHAHKILDVGCGTGNVAVPAAFAGVDVKAIDVSGPMLDILASKSAGFSVSKRISVLKCRAEDSQLWMETEAYDVASFLLSLFCMADGIGVLRAAVQSVKVGGLLVFTEPTKEFREEPLLDLGRQTIAKNRSAAELRHDWDVVFNAGRSLGEKIRDGTTEESLRANNLLTILPAIGCEIYTMKQSHLGECRFIVARRHKAE